MANVRKDRVGQQIHEEIAQILQGGALKDPRVGYVTFTGVKVDQEIRQATVFFTVIGDEAAIKSSLEGLNAARGFLRRELGQRLQIRHTPELHFKYDPSVANGARIESLISQVKAADAARAAEAPAAAPADAPAPAKPDGK